MDDTLDRISRLESEFQQQLKTTRKELHSSSKQQNTAIDKLYKRRQELVSGKGTPTADELTDYSAADDSTATGTVHKGVPYFWLNALYNQDTLADEISSRDKLALAYCTSVKAVNASAGGPSTLEMSFSSNPFFSNNLLRRCLGDEEAGVLAVTTDIQWKDTAHKLTVKEVKKGGGKKGKKGGKGKGAAEDEPSSSANRIKPCASFFRFFLPDSTSSSKKLPKHVRELMASQHTHDGSDDEGLVLGEEDEPVERKSAKAERDELIMRLITEEVLPKAAQLYMSGPLQSLSSDEDDDNDGYQLVHGAAGLDPSELPGPVQALLAALRHNQTQIDVLQAEREQLRAKAKQQEVQLRKQLAQQRRELLVPSGSGNTTVPRFWLRVLRSADAAALAVSPRDAAVLAHLADVRFSLTSSGEAGGSSNKELHGKLELDFLANPYLSADSCRLVKEYTFETTAGGEPYLLHSKVTAAPVWSSAERDPTHKKGTGGKQRPASSIFQLFKQGGGKYAFNLTGSEKDVQGEANELETELLMELHSQLLLKAGTIYRQLEQEGWAEDDSPQGDTAAWQQQTTEAESEESDSEAAGSDDEADAAHKAAVRRAKQKQHGWKFTKASVLIGLILLMLLAELFVFLDMAGLFRSSKKR